jgi:hypothetical protein
MPPEMRMVPRFAAEPPQDSLPYGRWAARLGEEFLAACLALDAQEGDLGTPGELVWFPDRTWHGRTYVPVTARTTTGFELFGYVSYARDGDGDPSDLRATADVTTQTAEANPDWTLDLCDEEIGTWRGEEGRVATMTLVWGIPLVAGGAIATGELADLAVDQCILVDGRFTLVAPDDYRHDTLDVKLFDRNGRELARESLYTDDEEPGA